MSGPGTENRQYVAARHFTTTLITATNNHSLPLQFSTLHRQSTLLSPAALRLLRLRPPSTPRLVVRRQTRRVPVLRFCNEKNCNSVKISWLCQRKNRTGAMLTCASGAPDWQFKQRNPNSPLSRLSMYSAAWIRSAILIFIKSRFDTGVHERHTTLFD